MSDPIDRRAVLDALNKIYNDWQTAEACQALEELSDAIEALPSATCGNLEKPEKPQYSESGTADCNLDTISRQVAIDALKQQVEEMTHWSERYAEQKKGILTAINIVSDLPSAQPDLDEWCTDCK